MKIGLLIQRFPGGGAENYVEEIATRLHKKGEDVTVITSENKGYDDSKCDFKIIRLPRLLKIGEYFVWKGLEKVLEQEKFDIIHTNTYGYYHSDKVARLKKKLGYKLVMTSHGFTGMDLHNLKKDKIISQSSPFDFLRDLYDEKIGKKTLLLCDHLIALSSYDFDFYKKIGVDESKISIIPPGINEIFFKNKQKKILDFKPILLSVGELSWNKNQIIMIKAMPKILEKKPNAKLILIGPDAGEENNIRDLCIKLGITEHILFLGKKSPEEISNYMDASDLLLQTSFAEGLSTVLLESMARELPFMSTPAGGNNSLCDLISGKSIPFNDYKKISQEIFEILDNQEKYETMKDFCLNESQNFSWYKIFPKIFQLYEKLF
jgi:glycosyltransferase involved in cell wall biosynthesis